MHADALRTDQGNIGFTRVNDGTIAATWFANAFDVRSNVRNENGSIRSGLRHAQTRLSDDVEN